MTTLRALPRRTLAGLATLSAAAFIAVTTETMPTGLLPQISAGLGVSQARAGWLIGVYALVVALGSVPLAIATSRVPRKALIMFTLTAYGSSSILVTVTSSFPVALSARAIGGVGHALFFAVASAYATRLVPPHLVGRATAIIQTGGSLALVAGVPIGTAIGLSLGWRAAFLVLAAAALLLMIPASKLLPSVASSEPVTWSQAVRGLRAPGLIAIAAVCVVSFAAHYSAYTYISPLLTRGGIGTTRISAVLLLFGFGGVVGVWLSGMAADRRPERALIAAFVALPIGLAVLAASSGLPSATIIAAVVWSMAFVTTPTLIMTAALRAGHRQPDMAAAMVNSACNLGIASGAVAGGVALTHLGLGSTPLLASGLFLGALYLVVNNRGAFALPEVSASRAPNQHDREVVSSSAL